MQQDGKRELAKNKLEFMGRNFISSQYASGSFRLGVPCLVLAAVIGADGEASLQQRNRAAIARPGPQWASHYNEFTKACNGEHWNAFGDCRGPMWGLPVAMRLRGGGPIEDPRGAQSGSGEVPMDVTGGDVAGYGFTRLQEAIDALRFVPPFV